MDRDTLPAEEQYSRVTDPDRYRIVAAGRSAHPTIHGAAWW